MVETVKQSEPKSAIETAEWVISQFRQFDVPAPARIQEMHRVLSRGLVDFDDSDFPTALESMRDLDQLKFIFETLGGHAGNPRFRAVLRHVSNDSALPQYDSDSPGRDHQFELYMGAVCQRAGLIPVDFAEPDVTCMVAGTKFGIAAKRLKSKKPTQIKSKICQGALQLGKSGLPGIVALELTISRNHRNVPMISQIQNQLYPMIAQAKGRSFTDEFGATIHACSVGTGLTAVLVNEFTFRYSHSNGWHHDGLSHWVAIKSATGEVDQLFSKFYDCFLGGFPKLVDLD